MLSKQEEIQKFERWYNRLEEGSYLKGIFKGMDFEVEEQIRNDFAVPVIEKLRMALDENLKTESKRNEEIRILQAIAGGLKFKMQNGGRKASRTIKNLRKYSRDLENSMRDYKKRSNEYWTKYISKVSECGRLKDEVERLNTEVKRQFNVIKDRNLADAKRV